MALKGDLETIREQCDVALRKIRQLNLAKSYLEGDETLVTDILPENKQAWRAERDAAIAIIKATALTLT